MQRIGRIAVIFAGGLFGFFCFVMLVTQALGVFLGPEMSTLFLMVQAGTMLSLGVLVVVWLASLAQRGWRFVVLLFFWKKRKHREVQNGCCR